MHDAPQRQTPLDKYVHSADSSYRFDVAATIVTEGATGYVLDLTSQTWTPPIAPDRALWKHWLTVVRPDQVNHSTAFLFITDGSNGDAVPTTISPIIRDIALATHTITAELTMVPNQPLRFADAGVDLREDALVAYAWEKFLRTGNDLWPLQLPMTKSAVRAMDAIQTFLRSGAVRRVEVDDFAVCGASKRGWTAWTTAAVDRRVVAVIPMVIDALNIERAISHHQQTYGGYSPSVRDYEARGIMGWIGRPEFRRLRQIEEPYEYRDRLSIPKYIVNAAGDQYFVPDSSTFYFDALRGEKHLRYIPNADHSLQGADAAEGVIAFYQGILQKTPRPIVSWDFARDGSIRVTSSAVPHAATLWQASNPHSRDFRLESIGPAFRATRLRPEHDGTYLARPDYPHAGWTAAFIELRFETGGVQPLTVTTGVRVTPDTLPFAKTKADGRVAVAIR